MIMVIWPSSEPKVPIMTSEDVLAVLNSLKPKEKAEIFLLFLLKPEFSCKVSYALTRLVCLLRGYSNLHTLALLTTETLGWELLWKIRCAQRVFGNVELRTVRNSFS